MANYEQHPVYRELFATNDTSIFRFRHSRAGKIAREVLGEEKLPGVLIVDRYAGYNRIVCDKQYCFTHLLRTIKDMEKEFPNNEEITCFVQTTLPLLSNAMNLRSLPIDDNKFYKKTRKTKKLSLEKLEKRTKYKTANRLKNLLDTLSENPDPDIYNILFADDSP
ncbi:MAG: transposase [Calditrichales bacterium]|nr:transposase [Calditrichales bacterium]